MQQLVEREEPSGEKQHPVKGRLVRLAGVIFCLCATNLAACDTLPMVHVLSMMSRHHSKAFVAPVIYFTLAVAFLFNAGGGGMAALVMFGKRRLPQIWLAGAICYAGWFFAVRHLADNDSTVLLSLLFAASYSAWAVFLQHKTPTFRGLKSFRN